MLALVTAWLEGVQSCLSTSIHMFIDTPEVSVGDIFESKESEFDSRRRSPP